MMVATHLSYRKAADMLFITQPAVTKQIMLLEKELGVELFVRSKREVSMTPAGKLFHEFTVRTKAEFENYCMRARQLQNTRSLNICMQMNIRCDLVTDAVTAFLKRYPTVAMRFEFGDLIDINNAVAQRHYDLYVTNTEDTVASFSGLVHYEIGRVGFSFLVKRG